MALDIDDGLTVNGPYGRLEIPAPATVNCDTLQVTNKGRAWFYAGTTNGVSPAAGGTVSARRAILIGSGSAIYPICDPTNGAAIRFTAEKMTIETGGVINANASGFQGYLANNYGRGPGGGKASDVGSGAGYGGAGGKNNRGNDGGPVYGSPTHPTLAGSAGGRGSSQPYGGTGGGLVWIETSRALTINGTISASGGTGGGHSGGGSGGAIYIRTGRLGGNGTLTANGGLAGSDRSMASGGGGGRIAVWRITGPQLTTDVAGGLGYNNGGEGSVYWGYLPSPGTLFMIR